MILKICGITNQADADAAMDAGANAVGFNFYARSPRYLAPEQAAAIRTAAGVRRVGVFVNEARARVEEIARMAALDVVQLHGDEGPGDYPAAALVWKAVRVGADFHLAGHAGAGGPDVSGPYRGVEALVLDGPAGGLYGGAGRTFDWTLASGCGWHIVLAGGLDGSNVAQAIELARPWGVDACSRIESAPGKKDHQKMREFLQAARTALGR
jgi:phosphoribosylanthranilate isomerase